MTAVKGPSGTRRSRPRATGLAVTLVTAAAVAAGGGCAGMQMQQDVHQVRQIAKEARDNGAYRCAPKQLALAETHVEFADTELSEGDYFRAREHLQIADDNAREAYRLSPRNRCVGPADRDGDGITDDRDKCPDQPEDKDGFEDEDGCPDPDNDRDGIADAKDKCPNEPEDKDGFEDEDGCPDPDNDKDGVLDAADKCPLEPGPPDNAGCPKKFEHIVVTDEKIELKQKIFFETDKAVIMPRSFGLLDEIGTVLRSRPTMRVRIEGHTDARGTAAHNLKLSQARADSVRQYLIGLGIDGVRMESHGFGPSQPIETNKTAAGRERNRRVEFFITQQ
ncbi:MAG TPA: OmpA family protein [Polyangia bacterium]|nr:OmpA family protein [Polyangia bacterium]